MSRIPPHAKKVFEGIIFDVYHWEQEQFDGTFKTFEGLRHIPVVIVVPIVGDKIYLHKEEQPGDPLIWTLPAGRFERGEIDPLAVASRELLEETGYFSDEMSLLRSNHNYHGNIEWESYIFVARNCKKISEPKPDPGERIHEIKLLAFEEVIEFSEHPDFRSGILENDWKQARMDPVFREEFRKKIFEV
jgi:ADP-ribose pyrophosphatase